VFRAYLAYFDLGLRVDSEEKSSKFSYKTQSYNLTQMAKEILSLDQLLALKTGQTQMIPD